MTESKSLHEIGVEILRLFKRVNGIATVDEEWPQGAITAEADRFELWSINLGLFVSGHGSLDYRLREAESLTDTIRTFLASLSTALAGVIEYWRSKDGTLAQRSPDGPAADVLDLDALEDEGDFQELGSDADLLLDSIKDPIDRLYKVSIWIRNPSSRFASSKALNHQEIDAETDVDLLQIFAAFDYDFVSSKFLQYRKDKALKNVLEPRPPIQKSQDENAEVIWEPIESVISQYRREVSTQTESFLVRRIAQANVRRRQQFAYWRKHRDKLSKHSTVATRHLELSREPRRTENLPAVIPSVTTATHLQMAQSTFKDDESRASVSEYAPSISSGIQETVEFPPAPKRTPIEKFFECQYCFTFCPTTILGQKAWNAHLVHDLRPYICTYENCKNPDQLYDSREDWIRHENSHRKVFRCPEHQLQTFETQRDLEGHLKTEQSHHHRMTSEAMIDHTSDSTSMSPTGGCPICSSSFSTRRALNSHIARHLEIFSLFSLPRSINNDQDELDEVDSNRAMIDADDFGAEDFDADPDIAQYSNSEGSAPDIPTEPKEIGAQTLTSEGNPNLDEVTEQGRQELEMIRKTLGAEHPDTLNSMDNLAFLYQKQGQWKEAEELFMQVFETRNKTLGAEHPDTLRSMDILAYSYERRGQWIEAEELFVQAFETRKKMLGAEHPDTLRIMDFLAFSYQQRGQWKKAEELFMQLFETKKKMLGAEHVDTLRIMDSLALSYTRHERWKEAAEVYAQAFEARKKMRGAEHPDTLQSMDSLALLFERQGRLKKAEELEFELLEIRKKVLGPEHSTTLYSMQVLAKTIRAQGRLDEAISMMENASNWQIRTLVQMMKAQWVGLKL